MGVKTRNDPVVRQTFLLDKAKKRPERFSSLFPEIISSLAELRISLAHATKDSLWISYEKDLTEALLRTLSWPARPLGVAVLVHAMNAQTLPAWQVVQAVRLLTPRMGSCTTPNSPKHWKRRIA